MFNLLTPKLIPISGPRPTIGNMTDIFGVESEIANGIAGSLQAKLTGHEQQALAVKPTNNLEAYDAYLRGLAFEARYPSSYSIRPPAESHGFLRAGSAA